MYQILRKLFPLLLCLSILCVSVSASNPSNGVTVNFNYQAATDPSPTSKSFSIGSGQTSSEFTALRYSTVSFTSASVVSDIGTTTFELSPVGSNFSASTSSEGCTVSYTVSGDVATVIVNRSSSSVSELVDVSFSGSYKVSRVKETVSASGYSFSSAGSNPDPVTPPSHTMQGMQNGQRWILYSRSEWKTYNQYIGFYNTIATGKNTLTDGSTVDVEKDIGWVSIDTLAELGYNAYSWTIDSQTKALKFSSGALSSSWLDMIWKYQTYNFYWGLQLMTNQTDGNSWFDMISTDFSYLNFRVNQLFEVLSNDEDLEIKNATDEERTWVQDYFTGSGDKADTGKYDKLNNTGSAFKDAFAGAPDSSIADGFTAVNDNSYDFWSQEVSNDINGVSSSAASRAPAYVPPEQRIVDAYSENWKQIVGGYYD